MPKGVPQANPHKPFTPGPYGTNQIREYRLQAKLTQDALARRLRVTLKTVTLWEHGWQRPRIENLFRLARELDTLSEALFFDLYRPKQ